MNAFSIILWRMSKMVSQKNEKGVTDTKEMDFACKYFIYVTLYLLIIFIYIIALLFQEFSFQKNILLVQYCTKCAKFF